MVLVICSFCMPLSSQPSWTGLIGDSPPSLSGEGWTGDALLSGEQLSEKLLIKSFGSPIEDEAKGELWTEVSAGFAKSSVTSASCTRENKEFSEISSWGGNTRDYKSCTYCRHCNVFRWYRGGLDLRFGSGSLLRNIIGKGFQEISGDGRIKYRPLLHWKR